eukprot:5945560-Pyramimonas_sp.AAC.1
MDASRRGLYCASCLCQCQHDVRAYPPRRPTFLLRFCVLGGRPCADYGKGTHAARDITNGYNQRICNSREYGGELLPKGSFKERLAGRMHPSGARHRAWEPVLLEAAWENVLRAEVGKALPSPAAG